jgi:acyl carrier protein
VSLWWASRGMLRPDVGAPFAVTVPTRRRPTAVERRVRRVVAEQLGVDAEELTPEVSLSDDLAADSLDFVELGLRLEDEFGIEVPATVIDEVRTYRNLVDCVQALARERRATPPATESGNAFRVSVQIVPAPGHTAGKLWRAGPLTPYFAETIGEDALRAGPGARLEISVPSEVGDAGIRRLVDELGWLRAREIQLSIRRDPDHGAARDSSHPHAA